MIETEDQGKPRQHSLTVKCSTVLNKTFSGVQRQLTLLKLILVFALTFMFLTLLLSLLYNTCLQQTERLKESLQSANDRYDENYKYSRIISNRSALSGKEMKNIRMEFDGRKRELEKYCQIIGKTNSNLDNVLSNMIIDRTHRVSWCPIYKAASSTWMKHFAVLGGVLTETAMDLIRRNVVQVNTIVKQAFPRDPDVKKAYQKLSESKKFIIVRHPFERLVSAYRDKLEHMRGREYYYKRFGRHITHKYQRYREENETSLEPTFTEFLRFIVDEKYFDEHWAPFVNTCEPCSIHYDYILKFDTFDRDQRFLIQELDLSEYLYQQNVLRNVNPRGVTTNAVVKEYMKSVPRDLLNEVNKVYEQDYKLFSYVPI